jgi:selenide, water dikinase
VGPEDLEKVMRMLPLEDDNQDILVGLDTPDDAAVFMLDEDMALVQTLDFFTPIVDDPYLFGQIAAANSLSDIYAMGATPMSALNIVCFPCSLGMDILARILQGGLDKIRESGASLLGGHTVDDEEPKYGLSVTGRVHPDRILTRLGAEADDLLILTKPLGTGVLSTAIKGDFISEAEIADAIEGMARLNAAASRAAVLAGAHACTDVTGFGLLGHLHNMLPGHGLGCEINFSLLELYNHTREMAEMGMIPAGAYKNRDFLAGIVDMSPELGEIDEILIFDPQTSGGLLIALPEQGLEAFTQQMGGEDGWRRIGRFFADGSPLIRVMP